jgi:hypothetical protein
MLAGSPIIDCPPETPTSPPPYRLHWPCHPFRSRPAAQIQREEYTQLTFDAALGPGVFETGEWKRPGWIRK